VGVEFGILGPLQVLVDGTPVSLGGPQQRAVLAMLLAHANQTVPVDRLIDDVWGDSPPETAGNLLQGYVSQLRKALGKDVIATRGRGYAVVVPAGGLDLHQFEQRAEAGMARCRQRVPSKLSKQASPSRVRSGRARRVQRARTDRNLAPQPQRRFCFRVKAGAHRSAARVRDPLGSLLDGRA
jgi:DNA-binding winged helix-turn-helix (wHTH) protein